MAQVFQSTDSGYRDPQKILTLQALQDRQKQAAAAANQATQVNQPIANMWQGFAHLGDVMSTGMEQGRLDRQSGAERADLANLMAGIDPDKGPDMATLAKIGMYDPATANKMRDEALQRRADDQKYQRERADKLADQSAGWAHDETVRQEGYTHDKQVADDRAALDEKVRQEGWTHENQVLKDKIDHDEAVLHESRTYTEGRQAVSNITGDEAAKRGLDPTHTYELKATGETSDITPDTYRPATDAEITAAGVPRDPRTGKPTAAYQFNNKTGKLEAINAGGGQNINVTSGPVLKATQDADTATAAAQQTIDSLSALLEKDASGTSLNDRAGGGWGNEGRAFLERNDPTGLLNKQHGRDATDFKNIIDTQSVQNLKAMFGGNPSDAEGRRLFDDLAASISKSPQEREPIIRRAIEYAHRRLAINAQRGDQLRGGTYTLPGGGQAAQASSPVTTSKAAGGGLPTPQTQADFDALPPGAHYTDPDDGQEHIK